MRRLFLRISVIHMIVIAMLFVTACGENTTTRVNDGDERQNGARQERQADDDSDIQLQRPMSLQSVNHDGERSKTLSLRSHEGAQYVLLRELVDVIEFQSDWDEEAGAFRIGDTDVIYTITVGSTQAMKDEEPVQLLRAPLVLEDDIYLDKQSFEQLFIDDVTYAFTDNQLVIYATDEDGLLDEEDPDLDFADDPNDDAEIDESVWLEYIDELEAELEGELGADLEAELGEEALEVLKKVNRSSIIATARRYLGVKYRFGAKPYAQSRRFDCSSFTQHVYKRHGVSLRRTARAQARQGVAVSRKNLRVGDMLFFSVPGRFKSNKTVGHVGIYMGKNRMIHAGVSPKNGVQITSINKSYWKRTFLRARRVVA